MQLVIVAIGSQGDVLPLVGLAARLRDRGHRVAVATQEIFAAPVRAAGLEFRALPGDTQALLASPIGQAWKHARSTAAINKAQLKVAMVLQRELSEGIVAATTGAEALLCHSIAEVHGYLVAQAMGIGFGGLHVFPALPTGDFLPAMVGTANLGRLANRLLPRLAVRMRSPLDAGIEDFQRELGLPVRSLPALRMSIMDDPRVPLLHGFSQHLVPRPKDWRPGAEVVGYWLPPVTDDWQPDPTLVDFLAAGPPPVYVGLGSMAAGEGDRLSGVVVEAVRLAGVRAVVQAGWAGLAGAGDDMITIGGASHEWLFPRMAAAVHHGGSGTTGAVLRAGLPAVTIPMISDQGFWAHRQVKAGISPGVAALRQLTPRLLADLIQQAVTQPRYRQRAAELAPLVRAEDGSVGVAQALDRLEPARVPDRAR